MVSATTLILGIFGAVFASTGFWGLITYIIKSKREKTSSEGKMIKGLGHSRICHLGEAYIKRGWITKDEYEDLHDYLYIPYKELGGDGTADKIMDDVKRLPIRKEDPTV